MLKLLEMSQNAVLDPKLDSAPKVHSFVMPFDSIGVKLQRYRTTCMFFDSEGRADEDLNGMPVLLFAEGRRQNRVVVKAPMGRYVDITEATPSELTDLSMGILPKPARPQSLGTSLIGLLFGLGVPSSE